MNRIHPAVRAVRRRVLAGLLLGALLAAGCGRGGDVSGGGGPVLEVDTAGIIPLDPSRPLDTLRMASLNMSIGFPVSQLLFTDMDDSAIAYNALHEMYGQYAKGYPTDRVEAMAREIARESLHVVGLQEVMTLWKSDTLINDFLPELVAAIKAEGGPDYAVFRTVLNDTSLAGRKGDSSITIRFREGNAVLVHPDIAILDSSRHPYKSLLTLTLLDQVVITERSADYLRLKTRKGVEFQVFNTHLEVISGFRISQAKELARLANSKQVRSERSGGTHGNLQVILADLNSAPGTEAHLALRDTGFVDTREGEGVAQDDGLTCCVAGSRLWDVGADSTSRRIDYVMARGMTAPLESRTRVKGPFQAAPGGPTFLASDHRMVVAVFTAQ
jgi:endonuclease/exonuclease/phosphatase family metal-dependent hydrolase